MEQHTSHPTNRKAKEEGGAVSLCRAKPSPSYINLQANSPPTAFLNIQATELFSVIHPPLGKSVDIWNTYGDPNRTLDIQVFLGPQVLTKKSGPINKQKTGVDYKPKECLGLLQCMYANLQLQTQLAQQQMAILENLQASMAQLVPMKESKNSSLPAVSRNLLLNHLPQFSK